MFFPNRNKLLGFAWFAGVSPKGILGIEFEPEDMKQKKFIIRKFSDSSLAPIAGLKIGDKILAMNGLDVLDLKKINAEFLTWKVGQEVVVSVVRDGAEVKLPVKTIANE